MFFKRNYESISVSELNDLLSDNVKVIDVREPSEYRSGHIKSAKNVPLAGLIHNAEQFLDKEHTYYLVCQYGSRSAQACAILSKHGYKVINVSGGTGRFMMRHRENIA